MEACKNQEKPDFNGACFQNSIVEFDYCKAKCKMTTFDFKFFCDKFNKEECKSECKIAQCETNCPVPEFKQGICAKDGYLYPTECVLKCRCPDTDIRWKCRTPFNFDECDKKCKQSVMGGFKGNRMDDRALYSSRQWDQHTNYDQNNMLNEKSEDCDDDLHDHDHDHDYGNTTQVTNKTLIAYPSYDPNRIYAQLDLNGEKLSQVHGLLKDNQKQNNRQDKILQNQNQLIRHSIKMQNADRQRDILQMNKLDQASTQRLNLQNSIYQNKNMISGLKSGQNVLNNNQFIMSDNLNHLKKKMRRVNNGVMRNGDSLAHIQSDLNSQQMAIASQNQSLNEHRMEHKIHDQKLDSLKDMYSKQNMKQSMMMDEVLKNQSKLGELQSGQMSTKQMILDHDDNLKTHSDNMKKFVSHQIDFNGLVSEGIEKNLSHMQMEQNHMKKQNQQMKINNLHMKMEALHMADSDDHYQKGSEYHKHDHFYHHKYGEIDEDDTLLVGSMN